MNEKLFSCKFFEYFEKNKIPKTDFTIRVKQPEYSVDTEDLSFSRLSIVKSLQNLYERPRIPFKREEVEYLVSFENIKNIDINKAQALIPSRNNIELMKFTLSNLYKNNVLDLVSPVIIDDRSTNPNELKELAYKYDALYIRVDYKSDIFNFSVLNNVAAAFLNSIGVEDIILWNSDLWVPDDKVLPYLLSKHRANKKDDIFLTGSKLVYPQAGFCDLFDDNRFIDTLSEDLNIPVEKIKEIDPFGKVQYGGSTLSMGPFLTGQHVILPCLAHYGRFSKKEKINFDREVLFLTGAFIICDLKKFKEVGGLNPSMRFCHQDGDLCFKMREKNYRIMFYGKECFLYHAESMSLASKSSNSSPINHKKTKTYNNELFSNELVFALRWNEYFYSKIFLL